MPQWFQMLFRRNMSWQQMIRNKKRKCRKINLIDAGEDVDEKKKEKEEEMTRKKIQNRQQATFTSRDHPLLRE